jgi:hypothetical protein
VLLLFSQPSYDRILLDAARRSLGRAQEGDFEIAVVVAQMATEIVTEQRFRAVLQQRLVPELDEVLGDLLSRLTCNERVRKVYELLSVIASAKQRSGKPL